MLFRPNPASGVPIYLQLMEQVKHAVETGPLRPGEQLPGIRRLSEELVINPNTVAKVYRELEPTRASWSCVRGRVHSSRRGRARRLEPSNSARATAISGCRGEAIARARIDGQRKSAGCSKRRSLTPRARGKPND